MGVVVLDPRATRVFGVGSASVIGQISYWLHKAGGGKNRFIRERDGFRWVTLTREELFEQIGLTPKQGRVAVDKLRRAGALVTTKHLIDARVVTHWRLDEDTLAAALDDDKPHESALVNLFSSYRSSARNREYSFNLTRDRFRELVVQDCAYCGTAPEKETVRVRRGKPTGEPLKYNGIDRVDPKVGYTDANCVPCSWTCNRAKMDMPVDEFVAWVGRIVGHFNKGPIPNVPKRSVSEIAQMGDSYIQEINLKIEEDYSADTVVAQSGDQEMHKKAGLSVGDILAGARSSKPKGAVEPATVKKSGEAQSVFTQAWVATYPDIYMRPLTKQEQGQLGHIIKRCPEGKGGLVIDYAVRHWNSFRSLAIAEEGAINPPNLPAIGTLLRFVMSAVLLYKDHENPVVQKSVVKATKPQPAPQSVQSTPEDEMVTDETELLKLLGKL